MLRPLTTVALLVAATLTAPQVSAQTASFTTTGQGCVLQQQQIAISNNGLPQLGQTMELVYTGPNQQFSSAQQIYRPVLQLGFTALGIPIPAGFLPAQPAGCTASVDPVLSLPMPPGSSGGAAYEDRFPLMIPNDPALLGANLFAQWACVFEQCGFAGCNIDAVGTSDLGILTFGN